MCRKMSPLICQYLHFPGIIRKFVILIGMVTTTSVAQFCENGVVTFEKTNEVKLDLNVPSQPLYSTPGQVVLLQCVHQCRSLISCNLFNIDYALGQCISFNVTEGRRDRLTSQPTGSYFEKMCFTGVNNFARLCGDRLWAFSRVIGGTLPGFVAKEEQNVLNRTACEILCLTETSFICRSAEYDASKSTCTLRYESRRSQPSAFRQDGGNTEYLENQCNVNRSSLEICSYETYRDMITQVPEDVVYASSEKECQTSCDQNRWFVCRSYSYTPEKTECIMSSEDSPNALNRRQGSYSGIRKCTDECTAGIVTYEKLTGYHLENSVALSNSSENTISCLHTCSDSGPACPAVAIDYVNAVCYKLDRNSQGRNSELQQFLPGGFSYFEQVCLHGRTQSCSGRLWAFERVPNHEISHCNGYVVPGIVQNRKYCEEACIQETSFHCRSATYNYQTLQCRLCQEDRRTTLASFVTTTSRTDYLENQCIDEAEEDSSNCTFIEMSQGLPRYVDLIISDVDSLEACKELCNSEESFTCRSLGYQSSRNECHLSGDDTISGALVAIVPTPGAVYYQRQCEVEIDEPITDATEPRTGETLPFPFTPPTQEPFPGFSTAAPNPSGRCIGGFGKTEYERTTGYKISVELSLLYEGGDHLGITNECIIKCNLDPTCQGFVMDYISNRCYALENDPSLNRQLLQRGQSVAYFEPICYQASTGCGKLWSFERFFQKQLNVTPQLVLTEITKADCEQSCLTETRFVCQSANYDALKQECYLNREDRFSTSVSLADSPSMDYLENECSSLQNVNVAITRNDLGNWQRWPPTTPITFHPRKSSQSRCYFTNEEENSFLSYVERSLNVINEFDCRKACDTEANFNCRSYSFVKSFRLSSSRCYLSADTKDSLGAEIKTQLDASYVERVCPASYTPFPTPSPVPPPIPPYPITPVPFPKPYPKPPFYQPGPPLPPPHPPLPLPPPPPPIYMPPTHRIYPAPYPSPLNPYGPNPYPGPLNPIATYNIPSRSDVQVFPLPGPTKYPGPVRCFADGDIAFERVTKLASQGYGSEVQISVQNQPTLDCLRECLAFGDRCQAITFKANFKGYAPPCTIYSTPSGGTMTPPTTAPNSAYFQKICLAGYKCGKAWTFDRVPFYFLEGYDDLELFNINSREECGTACLQQTTFPCRSAEYFYSKAVCRLSRETRRSQPYAYQYYGDGVEYLENQCNPEPGFCGFVEFSNKFMPFYDRRIYGVVDLLDCQMACVRETAFNCRSTSFDEKTKDCFLGSCDRFCGYDNMDRFYSTYSERVTCGHDLRPIPINVPITIPYQPSQKSTKYAPSHGSLSSTRYIDYGCDSMATTSFERTTGYAPLAVHHQLLPTSRIRGVTQECIKQCLDLETACQAFVLVYLPPPSTPECLIYAQTTALQAALPESGKLQNKPDVVFFEKICLKGTYCNKLWVFDRLFGYEFTTGFFMTYEAVETRKECEDFCLRFASYPCRSASYNIQIRTCRLNTQSRHTNPADIRYVGGDIQYLENQCIPEA